LLTSDKNIKRCRDLREILRTFYKVLLIRPLLCTWRRGKCRRATWLSMLNADLTTATVDCASGGGGVSPRAGASVCSNIPYINDTMPTSWVTRRVAISWVGSSDFLSNRSPPLHSQTDTHTDRQTNANCIRLRSQ